MNVPFLHSSPAFGGIKAQGSQGFCQAHISARLMPQPQMCFFFPQHIEVKIFVVPKEFGETMAHYPQSHQCHPRSDQPSSGDYVMTKNLILPVCPHELAGVNVGYTFDHPNSPNIVCDSFYCHQSTKMVNNSIAPVIMANTVGNRSFAPQMSERRAQFTSTFEGNEVVQNNFDKPSPINLPNNVLEIETDRFQIPFSHLPTQDETPTDDPVKSLPAKFIPLRNLRKLYFFLTRFFKCEKITSAELDQLADHELEILNLILWRKYEGRLFNNETEKKDIQMLVSRIDQFQTKLAVKRAEESFKFIFTRGIKHLKKVFRLNPFNDVNCSHNVDHTFFVYYFGEIANSDQSTFQRFLDLSAGKPRKARSLNLSYFKRVFSCQKFMDDLVVYLRTDFRADYDTEIERKCLQLLIKWDTIFNMQAKSEQAVSRKAMSEVSKYFLQNKRCKLPWTILEVNNAISRIDGLFTRISQAENTSDGL